MGLSAHHIDLASLLFRKVPQDVQTKGNITGTDFYRDPNSATYYKLDKTGKLKVNGGNPVRESGRCHPSKEELQSLEEHKPRRRFEDPWIQDYAFCKWQVRIHTALTVKCVAWSAVLYNIICSKHMQPSTLCPGIRSCKVHHRTITCL